MSVSRYVEIDCDLKLSSDCYESIGPEPNTAEARAEARKNGWLLGRGREPDICPTCRIAQQMERRYGNPRPGSRNMESS